MDTICDIRQRDDVMHTHALVLSMWIAFARLLAEGYPPNIAYDIHAFGRQGRACWQQGSPESPYADDASLADGCSLFDASKQEKINIFRDL